MSCCIQKKKTGLCAEPEGLYCVQWIIQVYKAVPFPDLYSWFHIFYFLATFSSSL